MRAKAGVAVTIHAVAKKYPELVQLFPEIALPPVNWWLVCHRDVNVNPRIHNLMTFLSQWFQQKKVAEVGSRGRNTGSGYSDVSLWHLHCYCSRMTPHTGHIKS